MFVKFPLKLIGDLTPVESVVLLRILSRLDGYGEGVCYESRSAMCEALKLDPKTLTKAVASLEARGLIIVLRCYRRTNQITLVDCVKSVLGGKNSPQTRSNIDLDRGEKFPHKGGTMSEGSKNTKKKRRPRRKVVGDKRVSDPILSEIDGIHRRWIKKQKKQDENKDPDTQE